MRLKDFDLKAALASTREDLVARWHSACDSVEKVDDDHRPAALRTLLIVAGLMLVILNPATLLLSMLAAADWLLELTRGVSVAGMLFDRKRSVEAPAGDVGTSGAEAFAIEAPDESAVEATKTSIGEPPVVAKEPIVDEVHTEPVPTASHDSETAIAHASRDDEGTGPPPHGDSPGSDRWRQVA